MVRMRADSAVRLAEKPEDTAIMRPKSRLTTAVRVEVAAIVLALAEIFTTEGAKVLATAMILPTPRAKPTESVIETGSDLTSPLSVAKLAVPRLADWVGVVMLYAGISPLIARCALAGGRLSGTPA